VHVLESLASDRWPAVRVTLVSPSREQLYSGMVPGFLQGQYEAADLSIDLRGLCAAAGASFVEAEADAVDLRERLVHGGARSLPFTLLSIDIGSRPAGLEVPGVRENATPLRPLRRSVDLRAEVDQLTSERGRGEPTRIVVVGGGAGGVEVALALHRRISDRGGLPGVTLVERRDTLLEGYSTIASSVTTRILERRGVTLALGSRVRELVPGGVVLESGARLSADVTVWVAGAAPHQLVHRSGLPLSDQGYLRVDRTLRAVGGLPVWGAGDAVDIEGYRLAKAGVYAVRQGRFLASNLRATLTGEPATQYRPQRSFLSILNTGDDQGLLHYRGLPLHSHLSWWLKDRIDRRFMTRFRKLASSPARNGSAMDS